MLKAVYSMKIEAKNFENHAENALRQCLGKIPFVQIDDIQKEAGSVVCSDFRVTLTVSGIKQILVLEVRKSGQPREARAAINSLLRCLSANTGAYGIFIAPFITPRTAEICRQEGVGYIDFAGNCLLAFPGIFIEQSGNPNPMLEKRDLRSLYSPKAARVLRVVLNHPQKSWKTQELADEAGVSLGQVFNVKKLLDGREWIGKKEEGFVLGEPFLLLSEWSRNYAFRKNRMMNFYSMKSIPDIEAQIAEVCELNNINYALTCFSGVARFTSSVRYQRAMAFVDADEDQWSKLFGFKEVDSGANVTLLLPYDAGVYYGAKEKEGVRVVSPVQLYLDLIGFRGRGEEAANMLLDEVIKPLW